MSWRAVIACSTASAVGAIVAACTSDYDATAEATDASASIVDASASDGPSVADAAGGCFAIDLDGLASVDVPASPELDLTPPFTIEAWIRPTGTANEQHVLSHHDHGAVQGYAFMLQGPVAGESGASLRLYKDQQDAGPNIFSTGFGATSQPPPATWSHVAMTMVPGKLQIFVNGVQKDFTVGVPNGFPSAFPGVLRMGRSAAPASGDFPYFGALDEVRLSKIARYASTFAPPMTAVVDADTIALWHFDEGSGTVARDATGRHDGTLSSSAKWISAPCGER